MVKAVVLHGILVIKVTGFAPTEIIYRIATRYILGFAPSLLSEQSNFRQMDTVPYAKEGRMEELIEREFGVSLRQYPLRVCATCGSWVSIIVEKRKYPYVP